MGDSKTTPKEFSDAMTLEMYENQDYYFGLFLGALLSDDGKVRIPKEDKENEN